MYLQTALAGPGHCYCRVLLQVAPFMGSNYRVTFLTPIDYLGHIFLPPFVSMTMWTAGSRRPFQGFISSTKNKVTNTCSARHIRYVDLSCYVNEIRCIASTYFSQIFQGHKQPYKAAPQVAHVSFWDPAGPPNALGRRSVELRVLAAFPKIGSFV